MCKSVLIRSKDDGKTWDTLYELSANSEENGFDAMFINVAFSRDKDNQHILWMWGSGAYRKSNVFLARSTLEKIEDPSSWKYLVGLTGNNEPQWGTNEKESCPLFDQPQVGEFSCAWIEPLQCWIMLYNASEPRGITLRSARNPWGPWSEGVVLFDPWQDQGYGNFIHIHHQYKVQDQLHDPGRENEWGGEYGPYLISPFTKGSPSHCEIYYTLSTWNPYQVVLMKSILCLGNIPEE